MSVVLASSNKEHIFIINLEDDERFNIILNTEPIYICIVNQFSRIFEINKGVSYYETTKS